MIKLKHLLTERLNWVSKKRARAELRQKISGQRNDDMGAYTGKIFGIGYKPKNNQDYSGPRTSITSMEELDSGKYMIFALLLSIITLPFFHIYPDEDTFFYINGYTISLLGKYLCFALLALSLD